jgi:hypothetical protein
MFSYIVGFLLINKRKEVRIVKITMKAILVNGTENDKNVILLEKFH